MSARGQATVEFVLVLPVLLVLLAAAIDLGRLFYAFVAVENASKEGALFGARAPLCDNAGPGGCQNPNNVQWHVAKEAPNLVDGSGNSLLTSTVACRRPNGTLVQPINDCLDGDTYQVTVSTPFTVITPILSSFVNNPITLSKTSNATVISDAFDPSGLEVAVWTDTTNATNAGAVTGVCTQADPVNAPGFYFQPCQDAMNVDTYLSYQEPAQVNYRVRVRNTGNVPLSSITYTFTQNGSVFTKPAACNTLPTSLAAGSLPVYCSFSRPAAVVDPTAGIGDDSVVIQTTASSGGATTGVNNGGATVKVMPAPRLAVNIKAGTYRLGSTGAGNNGQPAYNAGGLTVNLDAASAVNEIKNPVAWFDLTVVNQGGPAANFSVSVTRNGSPVALPASCTVPASLAATGQAGDRFECLIPQTFATPTGATPFAATASATNSITVGGQQGNVTLTTNTCNGGRKVVPNLVDTLSPTADGTNKTVGQAKALWTAAGFTGAVTTAPAGGANTVTVTGQSVPAYTCANANSAVTVTAP